MNAALPVEKVEVHESAGVPAWLVRFQKAPFILQAYTVFAIVISVLGMLFSFVPPLGRITVPYTGWSPGMIYMSTLYFAVAAVTGRPRKAVFGIVMMLGLGVVIGCWDMVRHLSRPELLLNQTNPYLAYATQRPVITIVAPLAWLLLLASPLMWKWIKGGDNDNSNTRIRQFALMDLLYLTMVVAICLALSIALVEVVKQKKASLAAELGVPRDAAS